MQSKWRRMNLLDVCSIKTGKHDANHAVVNGRYRFYTCASEYSYSNTYVFDEPSIIIPGNGDIGLVFYYDGKFDAYQRTYVLYNIRVNPRYLYYHLLFKWRHINANKQFGSTIRYVRMKNFSNYELIAPPIPEQERIVAKIEELFSELDKGVGALQKIKEQLKVYRQAVLKDAYSLENEKKCMLKECCNFITKGTTPKKNEMIDYKREIPFIKVYNLTFTGQLDFSIDPTFISAETHKGFLGRSITIPNDVLMNIVGPPMGKVSIVPNTYPEWNINQAIVRFRCLETLNYKYLAYFLMFSKTIEKMKRKAKATAGQFNLTLEICRDLEIPLPCIERQVEIITEIESRLSICERIEQIVDEALLKAESLRQSILKKAFEGKLVTQEETING
ncbi:MAG TPA: restriction endonuclease subunit S [Bacillota bacterium]|nr:restriction endonuclease subunit S [Bacillota bacterium]